MVYGKIKNILSKEKYWSLSKSNKDMYVIKGARYILEMKYSESSIFSYEGLFAIGFMVENNSLGIGVSHTYVTFIDDILFEEVEKASIYRDNPVYQNMIIAVRASNRIVQKGIEKGFFESNMIDEFSGSSTYGWVQLGNPTEIKARQ